VWYPFPAVRECELKSPAIKNLVPHYLDGSTMPNQQKISKVQLVGGLGNQLFCYAFGRYLEKSRGHSVVFDTSEINRGFTKHSVSILTVSLEGEFKNIREELGKLLYWVRRISFAIQARAAWVKAPKYLWPSYTAEQVGWDQKHEEIPEGHTFRGYFASLRYFTWLRDNDEGFTISLKTPSVFYEENKKVLEASDFLSLHVRRGDYVGMEDVFGLVGRDYFLNGIRTLKEMGARWNRIAVFSDDLAIARVLLEGALEGERVIFIDPPAGTDDAESMALMTLASCHVISNSSFSLWGAVLSQAGDFVIAPEPWSKGMPMPVDLLPSSWTRKNADFL